MKKITISKDNKRVTLIVADGAFERLVQPLDACAQDTLLLKLAKEYFARYHDKAVVFIHSFCNTNLQDDNFTVFCASLENAEAVDPQQYDFSKDDGFDTQAFAIEYGVLKSKIDGDDAKGIGVVFTSLADAVNDKFNEQLDEKQLRDAIHAFKEYQQEGRFDAKLNEVREAEVDKKVRPLMQQNIAEIASVKAYGVKPVTAERNLLDSYEFQTSARKAYHKLCQKVDKTLTEKNLTDLINTFQTRVAEAIEIANKNEGAGFLAREKTRQQHLQKQNQEKFRILQQLRRAQHDITNEAVTLRVEGARIALENARKVMQDNINCYKEITVAILQYDLGRRLRACKSSLAQIKDVSIAQVASTEQPAVPEEIQDATRNLYQFMQVDAPKHEHHDKKLGELANEFDAATQQLQSMQQSPLIAVADENNAESLKKLSDELKQLEYTMTDELHQYQVAVSARQQIAKSINDAIELVQHELGRINQIEIRFDELKTPGQLQSDVSHALTVLAQPFAENSSFTKEDREKLAQFIEDKTSIYAQRYAALDLMVNPPAAPLPERRKPVAISVLPPSPPAPRVVAAEPSAQTIPVAAPDATQQERVQALPVIQQPELSLRERISARWNSYSKTKKAVIGALIGLGAFLIVGGIIAAIALSGGAAGAAIVSGVLAVNALCPLILPTLAAGAAMLFAGVGASIAIRNTDDHAEPLTASGPIGNSASFVNAQLGYEPVATSEHAASQRKQHEGRGIPGVTRLTRTSTENVETAPGKDQTQGLRLGASTQ